MGVLFGVRPTLTEGDGDAKLDITGGGANTFIVEGAECVATYGPVDCGTKAATFGCEDVAGCAYTDGPIFEPGIMVMLVLALPNCGTTGRAPRTGS